MSYIIRFCFSYYVGNGKASEKKIFDECSSSGRTSCVNYIWNSVVYGGYMRTNGAIGVALLTRMKINAKFRCDSDIIKIVLAYGLSKKLKKYVM